MALLWRRASVISWDYLGKRDEKYPFQGNVHKSQALKFSLDITQKYKQILFFYGDVGSGKTRLAKETARQLASSINEGSAQPLLYLFLIDFEIYDKEGDLDFAEIQSQFAQTLKTFDESLSEALSKCKYYEFASKLSSYLNKRQQIFLVMLDGVVTNVSIILSFIENLITTNENVLLFVTSPTHLELPRLATKVSSYTCAGLTPEAARILLNVVAGHLPELAQVDEEIVSLCHMNPFLITRVGLQMRKDADFPYPPEDMRDLLNHSVGLAVSGGNVPEKDNIFKRELELTRQLTRDMWRKVIPVLNQPEQCFSAKHIAETLVVQTPAVVKKAYLQGLVRNSILRQDSDGFFSLNELFSEFFRDHRILVNGAIDDFVEKIYEELKKCLGDVLSAHGVEQMFMIHRSEMDHIRSVERRINEIPTGRHLIRNLGRRHFINACATFLKNIPITADKIAEFTENCIVILNTFDRDEQVVFKLSISAELDISDKLNEMVIIDQAARESYFERKQGLPQRNWKKAKEAPSHPSDEESSLTRFGVETASPTSKVSGFLSLKYSDDSVRVLASHDAPEVSTVPYKDTLGVHYFPLRHLELNIPPDRSSTEPEEVSFHDLSFPKQEELNNSPYQRISSSLHTQEISFHDFPLLEEETVTACYTARKTIITKVGGMLEIPNTGIALVIPPYALPADKESHQIQMRCIPRRAVKDQLQLFSSNSTAVVEILPALRLHYPVRLSLPHCLVLQQNLERKAHIFVSHHGKGRVLFVLPAEVTFTVG